MIKLPINSNNTHYEFNTTVDDIVLNIRIDYNTRAATWYMEIYDEFENLLLGSKALVLGYNVFNNKDLTNLPDGILFVINFLNENTDATLTTLGQDVFVMYEEN